MMKVDGIEPIDGWTIWAFEEEDSDRFTTLAYEAHHAELGCRLFQTSRFSFNPTQERFAWLLEHGVNQNKVKSDFGYKGIVLVPWTDESIDREIKSVQGS